MAVLHTHGSRVHAAFCSCLPRHGRRAESTNALCRAKERPRNTPKGKAGGEQCSRARGAAMKYDPYAYWPRFAGLNVLPDDAFRPDFHLLYDGYVYIGACAASVWLVDGKPESREQAIAQTMDYAWPYT